MTNTIQSDLYLSTVSNETKTLNNSTLGQDAFLKLLIAQLRHQDPANPMQDTEFISQMATFSELEQMMQMNKTLDKLVESQKNQQFLAYQQLLGKEVEWQQVKLDLENPHREPVVIEGKNTIKSISFSTEGPIFTLDNGTKVSLEHIKGITTINSNENSIVSASFLIGKKVSWKVEDEIKSAIVESVSKKDGKIYFNLDDEEKTQLTDEQIISIETV